MARAASPNEQPIEEEFIDMDFTSSPPPPVEFEFKMCDNHHEKPPLTSPADELFYKGKLLPLYLPPRLQMVEKLLRSAVAVGGHDHCWSERYEKSMVVTAPGSAAATPFESCNASACTSCYVSGELNPEDYFHECSAELGQSRPRPKRSLAWSKKLKFIKRSNLCAKLKASKAYIKSFFAKSNCSNEKCEISKAKDCSNSKQEKAKIKPATSTMTMHEEKVRDEDLAKRSSFSRALKRQSSIKSSSTSSSPTSSSSSSSSPFASSNSSSFSSVSSDDQLQPMLKRSGSGSSDHESSIQGAIAYCKKSQQQISVRKSASDVDSRVISASKVAKTDLVMQGR